MKVLGMISGTSHDGIDAAVVELTGPGEGPGGTGAGVLRARVVASTSIPYAPELRARLVAALPPNDCSAAELCALDTLIGQAFAEVAAQARAALDDLRAATRDGLPVRVTWVENDGRSTSRDLAPLDLSAGLVRAVDRANAEIVTIALSRIAAVEHSAMTARSASRKSKPRAFTTGPSSHTASALMPNAIARRMPATRERMRSST